MMSPDRLRSILQAYGADPRRWPAEERGPAEALLARSAEARGAVREAAALDTLLDRVPLSSVQVSDPALLASIIARTVRIPAQARPSRSWSEIFPVRLAFGWPNFAALAAAGIVGFYVGWTDINQSAAANRDMLDLIAPVAALDEPLW